MDDAVPTLLTVRPASGPNDTRDGQETIADAAAAAGLDPGDYEVEVRQSDDIETALVAAIQEFDTVCIGLSERTDASGVYGSVTEHLAREAPGNVALIRRSPTIDRPGR